MVTPKFLWIIGFSRVGHESILETIVVTGLIVVNCPNQITI